MENLPNNSPVSEDNGHAAVPQDEVPNDQPEVDPQLEVGEADFDDISEGTSNAESDGGKRNLIWLKQ